MEIFAFMLGIFGGALSVYLQRRKIQEPTLQGMLKEHFDHVDRTEIEIQTREYPYRVCLDV